MPMKNTIKPFLDGLGVTPYRFWHDTGISRVTAYRLYNDAAHIPSADVLVKICDTYKVQPGAFLLWVSDDESDDLNTFINQEKLEDQKQSKNLDETNPPHRHKHTHSFMSVVLQVPESA